MRMNRHLCAVVASLSLLGFPPGGVGASMAQAQAAQPQASPAPAARNAGWQPDPEERWLFDLRTTRLRVGDGVRGYSDGTRSCIDLTDMIVALDLPIRVDQQLRRATGWVFDERRTLVIDRDAGRVTIASVSRPISPDSIVDTPEGWCVNPAALGDWMGVTLRVDLSNAILQLESPSPLPFELAAQRRNRAQTNGDAISFNLADLPQARRPYALWQTPSVDVVASANVIRDARSAGPGGGTSVQRRYEIFASGEALGASFDARLSSDNRGVPQSLRLRAYRSDPEGGLLGPLNATHVAVGDVTGITTPIATQPVAGRGAIVTNRPIDLPDNFDRMTFRGDLPAGWDAELYRNGQLLGFATPGADGRYEFVDVRLLYGLNRFELVLYGPQGQVRREVRTIPVGIDAIPPQKTYYWAGVVQEEHDLLTLFDREPRPFRRGWRGMLGIERGLNRRTSVGAWASTLVIEDKRYSVVEASVRRSIGPTLAELTGSLQSGGGRAARLLWVGQLGTSYFQMESLVAGNGFRSDRIPLGVTGLHSLSFDQNLRIAGTTLPIHVEARYRQRVDGQDHIEAQGRVSANWRNLSLTTQVNWAHSASQAQFDRQPDDVSLGFLGNARWGKLRLRGEARVSISGPTDDTAFALVGEWAASERSEWRVEFGYQAVARRGRIGVGFTRRFDRFSLSTTAEAATDGSVAAAVSIAFGFGPDPRNGGIRFSRERIASQGQVLATVFMDDNGDGRRQSGEQLVEAVTITAGSAVAERPTGEDGQTIVDSLTPFRPVLIGVDTSSIANPLISPAVPGVVVTPRPGVATHVLLPLVAAGEVDGTLRREGGNGIEGIDLELVDQTGSVRSRARTEFDGFFIFETVPYGTYTLRIATLSAQAIGVESPLGQVMLSRTNQRARMGNLSVVARSNLARGPPPAGPGQAAGNGGTGLSE